MLHPALRPEMTKMTPHGIAEVARRGLGNPDIIPLWFGETDLNTADFIKDAAKKALDANKTFYSFARGVPELRLAIQNYVKRLHGIEIEDSRITVPGSTMLSLVCTLQMLLNRGENVVCVSPIWPNITNAVEIMACEARHVRLQHSAMGWSLDMDALIDACDDRTKAIFLNSPNNPTGWMATRDEQKAVLEFARKNGTAVISDEVYNRLVFDGKSAPSFLDIIDPDDLVFILNGFSKAYAMTGWRLGYVIAPSFITDQMLILAGVNNTGATVFAQYGGVAALNEGESVISNMVEHCRRGRQILLDTFKDHNRIRITPPDGAFYGFIEIDGMTDSRAFAIDLLESAKVGMAPGEAFGPDNEQFLRLCFAQNPDTLSVALSRLSEKV